MNKQMRNDGMSPDIPETWTFKWYKSLGDLLKCRFCFRGSGVGPDPTFPTTSHCLVQRPHFEKQSLRVSPWVSLAVSRNILNIQLHLWWFYLKYFLARHNSGFSEPALLGEERCLTSFQRLQNNEKKLTKEATAFKGAKFCWEQLCRSQLPLFPDLKKCGSI